MNLRRYRPESVVIKFFAALLPLFFTFSSSLFAGAEMDLGEANVENGKKLFMGNCATCHKACEDLTGPALKGALDRVPSEEWLYQWVKNSQSLVKSGDKYGVNIFNEWSGTIMTPQALSDQDIRDVMAYVEAESCATSDDSGSDCGEYIGPQEEESNSSFYWWLILAVIFFIVINAVLGVRKALQNRINEDAGVPPIEDKSYIEMLRDWTKSHKKQTALIVLVVLAVATPKGWYALKAVGVYQDYQPEQPIKFSHKIHAGNLEINCVYCHHSAEKGKNSGIPSVNVCMNCHKAVSTGSCTGEAEIDKIYAAAGWDKETKTYSNKPKPIKWVRIHNLPDFVYFNHSQHVVVGEQECQTCHGPVEEMHELKQHSELTMGWCINCHRETNVAMEGNAYYDKMHSELIEKYKEEGKDVFTVSDIGGLECAKCHY